MAHHMLYYIGFIFITTGINWTLLVVAAQYRILERWSYYKPAWLGPTCLFCVGFWLSVVQAVFWQFYEYDLILFVLCLSTAGYTNFISRYENL